MGQEIVYWHHVRHATWLQELHLLIHACESSYFIYIGHWLTERHQPRVYYYY